ncbi:MULTISPECIES: amidase [unclassified Streptomyces]|uniref:amidase n=1 Tax=unclassified Streptomyces TaxID=2593676 RepID=UPI002E79CA11|nr:amidase [Streptomyces sp. JV176]MEE1800515.1 amidase [Streptomyces sp. JV176]
MTSRTGEILHRFRLIHCQAEGTPDFYAPRYEMLRARPPQGCSVERFGDYFCLRCERPGTTLLAAVAPLCAEIREEYGVLMNDLGIEGLWDWTGDGVDGHGAEIVGQLLLMAAERGPLLGYGVDDLVAFLRTAAAG